MDYPGKVITKTQVTPTQTSASGNWTLDDQAAAIKNNNWPVALVPNPISKSLRFNSADSAWLYRSLATSGNRRTWTWSGWVKGFTTGNALFGASGSSGGQGAFYFASSSFVVYEYAVETGSETFNLKTTAVYRDPSAWYHFVVAFDTTQATSSNRIKIYVNGVQVTALTTANYPSLNFEGYNINNSAKRALIGTENYSGSGTMNGYMTEVNFIDGQALTPSDFGLTNPQTGQWIPKKYTGTYGTNGFYLNFKDATSTTTLGYDYSGNANNWTTNNFSVTAGSGNDSLTDVPTPWVAYNTTGDVGGVIRGNYCTLNPLDVSANTLSNGNLDITYATNSDTNRGGTIAVSTGKWYFEATVQAVGGIYAIIGVTSGVATATSLGSAAYQYSYISSTGNKFNNGSSTAYGNTYTTGDVIGVALDMDNGKVWFSKNGTFQASGDPAAGTNQAFSGLSGSFSPAINARSNSIVNLNCGQRPFAYTPPAGFRSLCTTNLPATTIGFGLTNQGDDYFNAVLYTGNGSTQSITGVGFQPDLVWLKSRSNANDNNLYDVVRGISGTGSPTLLSNLTDAETTYTGFGVSSLNSDGFTVIGNGGLSNASGLTYVAWNWKAGGTGVTNTAGSITSTVSASTTAGFSVVKWNGSGNATIGHGLGVAPSMYIVKLLDQTSQWYVYFKTLGTGSYVQLNLTAGVVTDLAIWQNTAPTSTVFSIGSGINANNMIAYCFAAVAGYSAFGSYTGNGSTDGPFVYLGFRPRYVMIKRTDSTSDWTVWDTARNTYNTMNLALYPDLSNAEGTTSIVIDTVSNGIKIRNSNADTNASGGTYIYAAFAESPFQFANAR